MKWRKKSRTATSASLQTAKSGDDFATIAFCFDAAIRGLLRLLEIHVSLLDDIHAAAAEAQMGENLFETCPHARVSKIRELMERIEKTD